MLAATPVVVVAGFSGFNFFTDILRNKYRAALVFKNSAVALASYYIAKKSYERYQQIDAKSTAK